MTLKRVLSVTVINEKLIKKQTAKHFILYTYKLNIVGVSTSPSL